METSYEIGSVFMISRWGEMLKEQGQINVHNWKVWKKQVKEVEWL